MTMNNYINPIKKQGDFADPFVIRYNGRYYLYCTNPDVRCWSSVDLVNWELEGPTIEAEEFPGLVPFAPEVVYWNGAFYMYTSPHGFGHYVLKSASPTGPFKKISNNVAHNIDGSILIDDDGQWYFYWADDNGIMGCKMKSPTEFGEPVNTGAFMYGWTEGPYVLKQNGRYYMTYTGNHFLSSGYRINAAVSDQPLSGYQDDLHNPIVIHTEGKNIGLGHNSTVLGPNLKSYYMVYHNLNPDATRDLNIDYLSWHGLSTVLYGPTRSQQAAPQLPDFSDYAMHDNSDQWRIMKGSWNWADNFYHVSEDDFLCLTEDQLEDSGVIETNLRVTGNSSRYGIIFGSVKEDNFYQVVFSNSSREVKLIKHEAGEEICIHKSTLPDDYNEMALHCLRVSCDSTSVIIYIDNRKQMELELQIRGGRVGYFAAAGNIEIGFTGFCNGSSADAEKLLYKPVPGEVPACTAIGMNEIKEQNGGLSLDNSQQLLYHINIEKSGNYTIDLFGSFLEETHWTIAVDGISVADKAFPVKGNGVYSLDVLLPEGMHTFGLSLHKGKAVLERIGFYHTGKLLEAEERSIAKFGEYGKELWGEDSWCDYQITAKLRIDLQSDAGQAGILFRVTEPSEGGEGNDPILGKNFFKGYSIGFSKTQLILSKHSYDELVLSEKEWSLNDEMTHQIMIRVMNDTFQVFMDGSCDPIIEYHDEVPYTHGKVGVRTQSAYLEGSITISRI
jgi:xylan 1,4-beta-xylosidase